MFEIERIIIKTVLTDNEIINTKTLKINKGGGSFIEKDEPSHLYDYLLNDYYELNLSESVNSFDNNGISSVVLVLKEKGESIRYLGKVSSLSYSNNKMFCYAYFELFVEIDNEIYPSCGGSFFLKKKEGSWSVLEYIYTWKS